MAVSQVTYSYTRVVPAGQKRVLDGSLKIGGATVDKAAGYRVVLNNFIADGGDGFRSSGPAPHRSAATWTSTPSGAIWGRTHLSPRRR